MTVPRIRSIRQLANTRLFRIEALDLQFANGVERTYERLPGSGPAAVIVVPVSADNELLLIREYAAGFHEMQLTLVKGAALPEESLEETADRELQEEVGYGARNLRFLKKLNLAPGHMGFTINVVLATDLYPRTRPADEPGPIELVRWPCSRIDELIAGNEFCEARAIAALCLARPWFEQRP